MARSKLTSLYQEATKYLGIPYFINSPPLPGHPQDAFVGKGDAKSIALETIVQANKNNIKLINLNSQQIYNFQKKHHLGIDCSALACHLLNFYFNLDLPVRNTSANALTSAPLAKKITDFSKIKTGDLIRQKNGHHVVFILEKTAKSLVVIDSSRQGRGVRINEISLSLDNFPHQGIWRLISLPPAPRT